jgi:hypothetical protein
VELALPESGTSTEVQLLPTVEQLIAGDAYPLYEQACAALPPTLDRTALADWANAEPGMIPMDRVKAVLDECQAVFKLFNEASLCVDCNWPAGTPGSPPPAPQDYRPLARLINLRTAYELAKGTPEKSSESLGLGLRLAQQLGAGPTLPHALVGIAIGTLSCRQVPALMEQSHSLNLLEALANLPTPFIDIEKTIQSELDNLDTDPRVNFFNRNAFLGVLEPAHERVRILALRFERDLKMLQCLEAIRLYAAAHDGNLPERLDQGLPGAVPIDPLHDLPFVYRASGDSAILESPAPRGEKAKVGLRYDITVRPTP